MPLYEYQCVDCGHLTELLQRHGEAPLETCPECGGSVEKLLSPPAFQFKGTGWYVTDYGGKKPTAESGGKKKAGSDSDASSSSSDSSKSDGGGTSSSKTAGAAGD